MVKLTVNGKEVEAPDGATVMQACELAGHEIPHFCFHERLNVAGNCRMCLVDMEKAPKPVASCAMPASEGMVIRTDTERVKKAREGVMEFLLINHPLDCPICDQGGECDLQDQAFKYGKGGSRYQENKRSVKDKYFGPLVKTHMTRCIHCTRCIRFATEVAGVPELGAVGRGENMEITSYLDKALKSELSGNVIDLCPVGALTSKPYAFTARSWELTKTESIDVMDAVGSNIRIDTYGTEVKRILPKINEEINEEWLGDKARFAYDGLKLQRLDRAYMKQKGSLQAVDYQEAIAQAASQIKQLKLQEIAAIAGTMVSCEAMYMLKAMLNRLGSNLHDANPKGYFIDNTSRGNYLFNTTIEGIEEADLALLIGANPKVCAPVLNARLRKCHLENNLQIARIGEVDEQTYSLQELGDDLGVLSKIVTGKHEFSKQLKEAKKPMVIVGDAVLCRPDAAAIMHQIHLLDKKYNLSNNKGWNGLNILHNDASMVGGLDIGFTTSLEGTSSGEIIDKAINGQVKLLYLLSSDDIDISKVPADCFVIYQGHHGDKLAERADLILPAAAYTEEDAIFVNLEGRPQYARLAAPPPGEAKANWQVIRDVSEAAGAAQFYNNITELRVAMAAEHSIFANMDEVLPASVKPYSSKVKLQKEPLAKVVVNYYMTNIICRHSPTMAKCTKEILEQKEVANV